MIRTEARLAIMALSRKISSVAMASSADMPRRSSSVEAPALRKARWLRSMIFLVCCFVSSMRYTSSGCAVTFMIPACSR